MRVLADFPANRIYFNHFVKSGDNGGAKWRSNSRNRAYDQRVFPTNLSGGSSLGYPTAGPFSNQQIAPG